MKVARKKPREPWELVEIENTLEALQAEVGGYIEVVTVCPGLALILKEEEGAINSSPLNLNIRCHQFFGTVLLCGVDGYEFTDLSLYDLNILTT